MADAKTIQSAFQPAFDEIARRSAAARSYDPSASAHFPSSDAPVPEDLDEQRHVLVSFGTAVLAPVPVDSSRPALRVYGAFRERDEAIEHMQIVAAADPRCSFLILKRDAWVLLPTTERVRDDPEESQRRIDAKLSAYEAAKREKDEYFDRVVRDRLERPPPNAVPVDEEAVREQEEAEACVYKPPRRLRAGVEVRGQSAFALCVLPDEFGECAIRILGCFETSAEAEGWVQNVGSRQIVDHDIFVASTCDWVYPNGMVRGAQDRYRHDELQRIMDAAARNPKAVRDYKEWKKEQDRISEMERARALAEGSDRGQSAASEEAVDAGEEPTPPEREDVSE